jgi:2-polyprenyl-3-methyl-5-hydroxy-6-metoxy-1,4-benzoquinol methylase
MARSFTWRVETAHPVAVDSLDHLHPFGTATDNNYSDAFNERLCRLLKSEAPPAVIDIGCAGGRMVADMWRQGWDAIGIEGSDYCRKNRNHEWSELDSVCLFTADATKPFQIGRDTEDGLFPARFDVVTAWEVLEHIEEADLPQFFENITRHLKPRGYFICSIASFPSPHDGVDLHRTIQEPYWWAVQLAKAGLTRDCIAEIHFQGFWVRTSTANFVLRKAGEGLFK